MACPSASGQLGLSCQKVLIALAWEVRASAPAELWARLELNPTPCLLSPSVSHSPGPVTLHPDFSSPWSLSHPMCLSPSDVSPCRRLSCPPLSLTSALQLPLSRSWFFPTNSCSQVLWRNRRFLVCWDQQKPPILSTKHQRWFPSLPSPSGGLRSSLTPIPEPSAHPGFLRKAGVGVVLAGRLGGGWVGFPWESMCLCVFVCSQPAVTRVPTSAGSASLVVDHLGRQEKRSWDLRAKGKEGCGPWQDTGAKTTHFLVCPFPGSRLGPRHQEG